MRITPQDASRRAYEICALAPVMPVLVVGDAAQARPLAEALVAGGLPALEVTLRTDAALDVIREMAQVKGGVVGAGTLITPQDAEAAKEAGAQFGVSPGVTDDLLDGLRGHRPAAAARRRHGDRGDAAAGPRLQDAEILSGGSLWRHPRAEGHRCSLATNLLLPHRRRQPGKCQTLPEPGQCGLRRRQLGRTKGPDQDPQLERN